VTEQSKRQSDQRQSGQDQNRPPQGGERDQNKSEVRRKAEEAARKDKPGGDASSVGNMGT